VRILDAKPSDLVAASLRADPLYWRALGVAGREAQDAAFGRTVDGLVALGLLASRPCGCGEPGCKGKLSLTSRGVSAWVLVAGGHPPPRLPGRGPHVGLN
jgi:hypothetical protein